MPAQGMAIAKMAFAALLSGVGVEPTVSLVSAAAFYG
jgi:hypothetical protein